MNEHRRKYAEFSKKVDTIRDKIDRRVSINEDLNLLLPKRAYDSDAQRDHYLVLKAVWSHYDSVGTQLVDLIGPIHPNFWKWADIDAVKLDANARIDDIEALLRRDEPIQHRLAALFPPDGTITEPAVCFVLKKWAWWLAQRLDADNLRSLLQLTKARLPDENGVLVTLPILDVWKYWNEEIHERDKARFALRFMESGIEPTVAVVRSIDRLSQWPEDRRSAQLARDFLDQTWTLQRHRNFPRHTSLILLTVLLCARRMEPALPREIWLIIFEFLERRDFVVNMRK